MELISEIMVVMMRVLHNIKIHSITASVPVNKKSIFELSKKFGALEINRLMKATGVEHVRITNEKTTASDLCFDSAKKIIDDLKLDVSSIESLIFVSPTPDYLSPVTSHILQNRLGLKVDTYCIDLPFGCSGYIMGLAQSAMLIAAGFVKNVLLLVGETPTKSLDPEDRATQILFGDAGSATFIEKEEGNFFSFNTFVDGSGFNDIIVPNSGFRVSADKKYLKMNGANVFSFATQRAIEAVLENLKNLGNETADSFIFHQANNLILENMTKKLGINGERVWKSIKDFGNTGAASIPLTITLNGITKSAGVSVLCGFGVGLSWGSVICNLAGTRIIPITEV